MKQVKLIIILTLFTASLFSQKSAIDKYAVLDKKALQIPDSMSKTTTLIAGYITANFTNEKDKTRAIFIWIATNIRYDIENMYALNFYEKKEDKILKSLQSRKGICENYAALFNDICIKSGINSIIIEGYTKQNGLADYIPHAWCAACVDSTWFLFDPTWGSGYVNGGKFYKKINNDFYKANPNVLIKSHIPFDYLWQFLFYPITNQEFYEGKTQQNKSKPYFNFIDSIKTYESQNHLDQLISSATRIEKNGIKNSLIFDRLQHIKLAIENDKQNKMINLYNSAAEDYNNGISDFNKFINYRNNQFTPPLPDSEIQGMIDSAAMKLNDSKTKLDQINPPDTNTTTMILQLKKSLDDAATHINEQKDWLKLYFKKGKSGRKSMFYEKKMSWFGIPLN